MSQIVGMLGQRSVVSKVAVRLRNFNRSRLVFKSFVKSAASGELIFEHNKTTLLVFFVQASAHLLYALLFFELQLRLISLNTLQLLHALVIIDFLVFLQLELLIALLLLTLRLLLVLVAETLLLLLVQLLFVVDDPQVSLVALLLTKQALLDKTFRCGRPDACARALRNQALDVCEGASAARARHVVLYVRMLAAGSEDAVAIAGGHVQMRGSALFKQAHALLAQVEAVGLAAPLLARPHVVPQLAEVEQQALHVVVVHCDGVIMICAVPLEIIFLAHDEVLWVDVERSHQVQPLLHTHLVQPLLQLKHLPSFSFREEELLYGYITLASLLSHRLN